MTSPTDNPVTAKHVGGPPKTSDTAPRRKASPGIDEIVLTTPPGRCPCNSLEHRRLGCLADVVVTFGELGVQWQRDALWQDSWRKSFAVCGACWDALRTVAQQRRPDLVIRDIREPAPPATSGGS
jgi:hypothetical protein